MPSNFNLREMALANEIVFLLEQVLNGLLMGVYYLLIALGLSIIFSLGGVVNLAHGALFAVGAYFMVQITEMAGYGVAFVAAPLLVAILGLFLERLFLFSIYYDVDLFILFTTNKTFIDIQFQFKIHNRMGGNQSEPYN
jgi:branched-chain amino acid transport system permease protein